MKLPLFLKKYQTAALENIKENRVRDIEFSGTTYQVLVADKDSESEYWAFMQLNEKGDIQDSFCSCESEDGRPACVHIATAYLKIYGKHNIPLHKRFEDSLWNHLGIIYADKMGYSVKNIQKLSDGEYFAQSASGKQLLTIKGKDSTTTAYLLGLIEDRHIETEETSLKFSNLSTEELMLWKEGRPSNHLRYELSFWNDFAKWLLALQERENPYEISFGYNPEGMPNWIQINFPQVEVGFYLSEANLPEIIPSLTTVNSPLKVYGFADVGIKKIVYNQEKGTLHIISKGDSGKGPQISQKRKDSLSLLGWEFVPGEGFYATDSYGLHPDTILEGHEIEKVLKKHYKELKSYLVDTTIQNDLIQASYQVSFDAEYNLHISCYVFHPGDLQLPFSKSFGNWVYIQDDGFYQLLGKQFPDIETVIPFEFVPVFVTQNRSWLNTQEGFHTHIVSVESHLTYKVDENDRLMFISTVDHKEQEQQIDFGRWVYIAGQGFYQKISSHISLPLRPGDGIAPEQIPLFIRMNKEELKHIPNFFAKSTPLSNKGLRMFIKQKTLFIEAELDYLPEYAGKKTKLFGDYVYIPDEGFWEMILTPALREIYCCHLEISPDDQDSFFETSYKDLLPFAIKIDPRLAPPRHLQLIAEKMDQVEVPGTSRYLVNFSYESDIGSVDALELWKVIKAKRRYFPSPAGLLDLHDDRFNWLRHFSKTRIENKKSTFSLSTLDILRLNAFDHIESPKVKTQTSDNVQAILKQLTEFIIPEEPDIHGLKSELRHYQNVGVHWLWFLYHQQLSGLLCDDMGLGKTHQSMALIAAILNEKSKKASDGKPLHFLVVCPTSVIYHWQDKLKDFLPTLRICTFYGSNRSIKDFHQDYDLLLTSYGIWRNEFELLSEMPFELAIFDEVQVAKNHNSQLHASLTHVQAKMKLGLTGTPIENRLRELKSLFDIVLPSYMPNETDFRKFFLRPIEKEQNLKRKTILSRFIKPFVLRRRKEEVLKELPEKTEEVSYCNLSHQQAELYQRVLEGERPKLMEQLQDEKTPIPFVHVFAILSHLKQICDHPAVYLKDASKYKSFRSGKWELFLELLHEARDSGQKIVIFSQYLTQLDIFQAYLKEQKIGFAEIRGATTNRGDEVRRFQDDPKCEVFLGSLQAAGLGIDLTAASVVIHYDRWWNAARENQATDRVHRIGQTRGVQVFKLVTKDTFEERINTMIVKKGQLMEDIVGIDDHQLLKQLNRNEILDLLRDLPKGTELAPDLIDDVDKPEEKEES